MSAPRYRAVRVGGCLARTTLHSVDVRFGDCDPAGIVLFPNLSRWVDAASLSFFMQCGLTPWRELVKTRGIVGTPLLEINTRFISAATYGQTLLITAQNETWRTKVFVQTDRITCSCGGAEQLIRERRETRAFVKRGEADPDRLRAIPVPEDIRLPCS